MKIEPRCLALGRNKQNNGRTKQIQFSSYGYFLPCCECDTVVSREEFERLGFFDDNFHISKINNTEDVKAILNSKQWKNFYKGLLDDPENSPKICQEFCKEGWEDE